MRRRCRHKGKAEQLSSRVRPHKLVARRVQYYRFSTVSKCTPHYDTRAISEILDKDGYIIIKDRSKDIIISGGENISSVELEDVLYRHPAVLLAAVVAKPDQKWGRGALRLRRVEERRECDSRQRSLPSVARRCPASSLKKLWCSGRFQRRRLARSRIPIAQSDGVGEGDFGLNPAGVREPLSIAIRALPAG